MTMKESESDMNIISVIKQWMEGEINSFIKVWLLAYMSLSFCYFACKMLPKHQTNKTAVRLVIILPVVCFFLTLPLNLRSVNLGGTTAFFLAWLANFKLLLFAFNKGPLSENPSISLPLFVAIACLPIKIQHKLNSQKSKVEEKNEHPSQNEDDKGNPYPNSSRNSSHGRSISLINYSIKGLLLVSFLHVYDYGDRYLHPKVILLIYCLHIYFYTEIILALTAALARTLFGLELEPHFNNPLLSTSLQDFWGRRWNLMVTRILRPTVYEPILVVSTRFTGRKWGTLPAILATFFVSGIMHELMFFYLGRVKPTWEITWFFLLHGVCLMTEITVKKTFPDRWRLSRLISTPLTIGFIAITCFWLFFPQILRCQADVKALKEYATIGAFVKDVGQALTIIKT